MTFDDLERLVSSAPDPPTLFGPHPDAALRRFRVLAHPDRNPDRRERAEALFSTIERLAAELARHGSPSSSGTAASPVIRSPRRAYALGPLIASGDVADVFHATGNGKPYIFKVSRVPEGAAMLQAERQAIAKILTDAGDDTYRKYFPTLAESFAIRDGFAKRANVYVAEPGWYSLEQVAAKLGPLDGRHLAWIFKRTLTASGFAHRCGVVHGAVTPGHILIHPETHGLMLVGWGHSVAPGEILASAPAKYLHIYPPEAKDRKPVGPETDLYLAAASMNLVGGDRVDTPGAIRRFFGSLLMPGKSMRPGDDWAVLDEFSEVLEAVYGPPKFVELSMS